MIINKYNYEIIKDCLLKNENCFDNNDETIQNGLIYIDSLFVKYVSGKIKLSSLTDLEKCLIDIKVDNFNSDIILNKILIDEMYDNLSIKKNKILGISNVNKYIFELDKSNLLKVNNLNDPSLIQNLRLILNNLDDKYNVCDIKLSLFLYFLNELNLTEEKDKAYLIAIIESCYEKFVLERR